MKQLRGIWRGRSHTHRVVARLDRAIRYAEAAGVERGRRGVLDAPVAPGHDGGVLGACAAFADMADTSASPARPIAALTFAQIGTT